MELHQLRIFIAIAREKNLTRASSTLCLSQPAVSAQLKMLEDELGVQLFERVPKGMMLTGAGALLLDEAKSALDAAKNLMTQAQNFRDDMVGEVRLGTISQPIALRLGEFLSRIVTLYPRLKVRLNQCISGEVIERVLARDLDAGYVIGDFSVPELSVITLSPITLHVVAPVKWKSELEDATWSDIAKFPWIGTSSKCSFNNIAEQVFAEHQVQPSRLIEADQESILRNLVAGGVGICFLREDQAVESVKANEGYIWTSGSVCSHLQFIHRANEKHKPCLKALLSVVHGMWSV